MGCILSDGRRNRKHNVINVTPVACSVFPTVSVAFSSFKYIMVAGDNFAISVNLHRAFITIISRSQDAIYNTAHSIPPPTSEIHRKLKGGTKKKNGIKREKGTNGTNREKKEMRQQQFVLIVAYTNKVPPVSIRNTLYTLCTTLVLAYTLCAVTISGRREIAPTTQCGVL